MRNRATASPPNRATASPVSLRLVDGDRAAPTCPRRTRLSLAKLGELWLRDGRAQGWSPATLGDRRMALSRFLWWLENEARVPSTLDNATAGIIRDFLIYAREPNRDGRYGATSARPLGPPQRDEWGAIRRAGPKPRERG